MKIVFKEVDQNNYKICAKLAVAESQKLFVAPNWYSLLEANYEADRMPFAIYHDKEMVGFIMFSFFLGDADYPNDSWWIERFMIDEKHQQKGYGTQSLQQAIDYFKAHFDQSELRISAEPENKVAIALYERLGFEKTGEKIGNETVLLLVLR
ncbi:GNAT family N-acetyltransferase [Amphibacillus cookii]|uniref:GNAT family N-acetyltransferase n=1 Tax=Amphibacillus cookii TaxID=767787 RepID=UPI001957AA0B|nr:GNAT family N-acetyltransferase [Amphibacillus cookii]MBM7541994.1 diamine N-acetyltransferase [Amphibacillus cookii]